ncbi:hypothetical protein DL98DRAFT_629306 [Cadophora sp. DSE1049]|nr:hypothetical protein DL98DRAFT_629306 [Cadophora sp. DSE1049]
MDNLFRFVSVRPAQKTEAKSVNLQGKTPFQDSVRAELNPNLPAPQKWTFVRDAAVKWMSGRDRKVVEDIKALIWHERYFKLRTVLSSPDADRNVKFIESAITKIFDNPSNKVVSMQQFREDLEAVRDSILLIFLLPNLHRLPLADLTAVAQAMEIIRLRGNGDLSLDGLAVDNLLRASITLPIDILPPNRGRIRPVGIGDLLVVKQHINRYELGEIVNIENILKGETRKKINKRVVTNERTVVLDSTTATETVSELVSNERFALKKESEKMVKEDITAKVGVSASAKYGAAEFSSNASLDYSNSKNDSKRVSSDYAKDVTSRASTKVAETIRVQQTTRIVEMVENEEGVSFDNTTGTDNVSGIYQWLNKVYTAQVFNYGRRLLFDIMVPEPAALILDAAKVTQKTNTPKAPTAFNIKPSELKVDIDSKDDPKYYDFFIKRYQVQGIEPPPRNTIIVAKSIGVGRDDKTTSRGVEVLIPDGYKAKRVYANGMYNIAPGEHNGMLVFVGDVKFEWQNREPFPPNNPTSGKFQDLEKEYITSIGVASHSWNAHDYAVTIQIECELTETAKEKWLLETHAKILAAYEQQLRDYEDDLVAARVEQPSSGPVGSNNPETNRMTERTELKRAAIQLLTQTELMSFNAITETQPDDDANSDSKLYPRPNTARAIQEGAYARFFEQAFEWEQMQYVFYPYFWARKDKWYEKATRTNTDPLYAEFLKAGQARVVVPTRLTMEPSVWYYLMTGFVWQGGDPPMVTDADYLSIAEEIKELSDAPGDELPYGPSWEITVPTSTIKLRNGENLEDVKWTLEEPWKWTPAPEGDDNE